MTSRLPTSVARSLGLHAGVLAAFLLTLRASPRQTRQVVEGVDLLISTPKAARGPKPPLSTMDFLKLALPTAPHAAAPAQLSLTLPQRKTTLSLEPKLQDATRRAARLKMEALDLSRRPQADMAKVEAKLESRRRAEATLAALPPLAEVGRRRVKNLPQALALEDERREAVALQGLPAVEARPPTRREALAASAALQDAAPPTGSAARRGLSSLLPDRPLALDGGPRPAGAAPRVAVDAPAPERRPVRQQAAAEPPKKGVEIEGPLADRKVAAYEVPAFPDWAKSQGILEADVSIRFTVDEAGSVTPGMRVRTSSGYGRLDRLALDALKNWRFVPKPGAGVQWGVITFRFILE